MKLKYSLVLLILTLSGMQLNAQNDQLKVLYELAGNSKNWMEGFQKNIGGNEFSYHSFRNDVSESIISRCNAGQSTIEWETTPVSAYNNKEQYGFLWIAALDLSNEQQVFDVYFNGVKRFEISTSTKKNWQIKGNDGGELSYVTVELDQHRDAHGYMSLIAPKSWIKSGESQKIKIVGQANNSNTWIIVYQASDALSYLQNSIEHDVLMEMTLEDKEGKLLVQITAPQHLGGETLNYTSENKKGTIQLQNGNGNSFGEIYLPNSALDKKFELNDSKGEVFVVNNLGQDFESTKLLAKSVLLNISTKNRNKTTLTAQRTYKPKTVSSLLKLSESVLSNGKIYLMNSSHQDIAWMDSPEKCVVERDTMLFSPLFELAQKDKDYRFDVEDALMIKEFIERHPDKRELVQQMLSDGRISCGSTFIQPYEEMYSGEALARQFYLGAKWLKDEFNYNANVYWNEDVPGRTLQMMQMMRKAGTKYMMISRHERGLFNWYSPDGSYVTTFSPGHYGNAFTSLQKNFHEAAQFLATSSLEWEKYYNTETDSPVIPLLSDWDMSPAIDYSDLINQWEAIDQLQNENGEYVPASLPKFSIASTPEFFDALINQNPDLQSISGERPAVWLYIHGPSHQKAIKASREGDILLTQAEKFATANALVDGSFRNYPTAKFRNAWEAKIYPDHGWGGKEGAITDALFHSKYEFAKTEAEKILSTSISELASKVNTKSNKGRPLIVFNSYSKERKDPVSVQVNFEESTAFGIELMDSKDVITNIQLNELVQYSDGSIKSASINFIADQVPSIGYKTWYLNPLNKKQSGTDLKFQNKVENNFYAIELGNGGLTSIFDKELNKELIDSEKFKAGEIFTMRSIGNGAGEFIDVQQPDMEGFDKTGNYNTDWTVEENGLVYTTYKFRQKLRNAVVEQKVKVYHQQKKIDFETALLNWDGELYREFRMALPLNMTDGQVSYEVPYGVVNVGIDEIEGAAGERYTTICKEIRPRGIENWIGASNADFGVTMSSSVVAADWIDPTDNPVKNQILQPILIASRKSCHHEGNEYLQTGNHHFKFSITSHKPGWENGADFGRQANEHLQAIWADHKYTSANLPETLSFFETNQENVILTTVKKAEDNDEAVVRMVDLEGKNKTVTLNSFKTIEQAKLTNLIEEEIKTLNSNKDGVEINLGHHSIETIKLKLNSK